MDRETLKGRDKKQEPSVINNNQNAQLEQTRDLAHSKASKVLNFFKEWGQLWSKFY